MPISKDGEVSSERTAACGGYYRQKYFVYIFQNGDEFIAAI
ncbi:hypothetical protein [Clostridium sp. AF02-29]|nr:hypothetical protein [Clostridium sp. AF02-29]